MEIRIPQPPPYNVSFPKSSAGTYPEARRYLTDQRYKYSLISDPYHRAATGTSGSIAQPGYQQQHAQGEARF